MDTVQALKAVYPWKWEESSGWEGRRGLVIRVHLQIQVNECLEGNPRKLFVQYIPDGRLLFAT